jgi:hypothetical protein
MAGDMTTTGIARALMFCAVAGLGACQQDAGTAAQSSAVTHVKPKAAAVVKKGPTAAELTVGMVEAASQGKSQVPVELKFELVQRPKIGQVLEINLALIPQIDANAASIEVSGADGLSLAPGAGQFDLAATQAGEVYRHTVNITPTVDGVLLVGVTVSLKHDEITDSKAFSIPIIAER